VTAYGPYPALLLDWHDGDTCHLNVDVGFGIILSAYSTGGRPVLSCRVFGINAPELNTEAGRAALAYAAQLCPPGTRVMVVSHGWDKYGGRFDGTLTLPDGRDYAAEMLAAGQAVPFTGG
jgi:endonuclease YncB( thermonuclease family)